jgi:hypothetical protein
MFLTRQFGHEEKGGRGNKKQHWIETVLANEGIVRLNCETQLLVCIGY